MAYDARALANFFLDMADDRRRELSAMALLKILYFGHAWHLAKYKMPLIGQQFEAWKHGPVNRVVYDQISKCGSSPISIRLKKLDLISGSYNDAKYEFDADLTRFLTNIFDYYSQFHPYKLSDLTHEKDTPWDRVWNAADKRAVAGMVIPDKLILEWFEKTGGRLYRAGEQGVNT